MKLLAEFPQNIYMKKKNYRINVHMRANGRPSRRSKSSYNIEHPIRDTSLEKEEKRGEKKNIYE
jgi:hypothetical protein